MDIEALSMNMAQERVQSAVGVKVEKMALDTAEAQSSALLKLFDSASVITDPALGNRVNILA